MCCTDYIPRSKCYSVKITSFIKKSVPIILILLFAGTGFAESSKGKADKSVEKWKSWVGKKVDVDYTACDERGCVLVRSAELKEVTEKAIVVIIRGSRFYIPKHMITRVALSKAQDEKLRSD
jgi:hypothetical protein